MLNKIVHNRLLLVSLHVLFGYLATFSFFPKIFGFACIAFPIFFLLYKKNYNEEALIFSAYIVGAEVFLRMTNSLILYETGKYAVILFLMIGFFQGKFNQKFGIQYLFYLLLLLVGVIFTRVPEGESIRKAIAFNLSGPILLGIAAIYFYKRRITKESFLNALFSMLLPTFSMVTFLYFRTPDLREIIFTGTANFEASGGFGPNQVATAIGLGIFILVLLLLLKQKITGFLIVDLIFLLYFIFRGLLTFSRGGLITGVIALLVFAFFNILSSKNAMKTFFKYIFAATFFIISVWLYASDTTGGMLDNRYTGKNASGVQKEDISSGRGEILAIQMKNFILNPLGIGVGNGRFKREGSGERVTGASHNEIGRLIEEHGVIGFIILIGLIIVPLFNIWFSNNYQRGFLLAFYLIWFLTINHSAMRIALPGFIYALSLIIIIDDEEDDEEE